MIGMKTAMKVGFFAFLFMLGVVCIWKFIEDRESLLALKLLTLSDDKEQQEQEYYYQLQSQNIRHTLNNQVLHHCKKADPTSCNGFFVISSSENFCPEKVACIYRGFEEEELFQFFPLPQRVGQFKSVYGMPAKQGNGSPFYREANHNSNERIGLST